jgi:TolA-binding protein
VKQRYPDFPLAHEVDYLLGRCHAARASFQESRASYRRVIESDAANLEIAAMAAWMIGETYFHQDDFVQAIDAYAALSEFDAYPRWQAMALLQRGKCFQQLGEYDRAVDCYSQVSSQHANTPSAAEAATRLLAANHRRAARVARKK